ncbi:MAG: tRNA (guanosine(46)-N7)-methyltransferase TrmB [Selenomonadaceae bacterium]|nr:tRNA (guanosine(46)-N7)-methyltransferase TrmB [Selenomonadaceae bacterium]MBR1858036.1 tRNA (guanosine(46)-N7)-methyltransferase TrmB [Selenomonadaceae bacterium]
MRLRKKSNINEKIIKFNDIIINADTDINDANKGHWRNLWVNSVDSADSVSNADRHLFIELGTGKGDFISQTAELNKNIYFLGLEMESTVLYAAAKKIREKDLTNVRLLIFDINNIEDIFDENEVDRIYINFCDPWPKKRHAKRRLTHIRFLDKYRRILVPNGEIHFKTDNRGLFDFSLEQFELANLNVSDITYDLHADNLAGNVETEYEKKFSSLGVPICRCVVKF